MQTGHRFRVNTPDVTHEVIDDEAVIINLESGHYYSLQGSGAEIWTLLAAQASIDEIVATLTRRYECEPSEARSAIDTLVGELRAENLIVSVDRGPLHDRSPADVSAPKATGRALERPALQKFTDMQELLLLDPIHDVDERGWPHRNVGDDAGRTAR
jgi:hypothetical protein